jgi:hypothetical protein
MKKSLRSQFLIDREIQFQVVGYVFLIWVVSTVGMAYLVNSATNAAFDSILADPGAGPYRETLKELQLNIRTFGFVGILIGMIGSLIGGIIVSHRVAGPIFSLKRAINKAVESGTLEPVHFRKGDFTLELGEAYNRLVSTFRR